MNDIKIEILEKGKFRKYVVVSVEINQGSYHATSYVYTMERLIEMLKELKYDMLNMLILIFLIRKTEALFRFKKYKY